MGRKKKPKKMKVIYSDGFKNDLVRLFSQNPIYAIPRWFSDKKYDIKWAWQRVMRGYDDRMVWQMNDTFADIAIKALDQHINNCHGYPCGRYDVKTHKDWIKVLKKIRGGFIAHKAIFNNEYMIETKAIHKDEIFEGMNKIRIDKKKLRKLQKQFDEGIFLFARYYQSLWD